MASLVDTPARHIVGAAQSGGPEDWARRECHAETIADVLPEEDALSALTACRFCDERRHIDCPIEVCALPEPPRHFDRHGARLLFGQNT